MITTTGCYASLEIGHHRWFFYSQVLIAADRPEKRRFRTFNKRTTHTIAPDYCERVVSIYATTDKPLYGGLTHILFSSNQVEVRGRQSVAYFSTHTCSFCVNTCNVHRSTHNAVYDNCLCKLAGERDQSKQWSDLGASLAI